MQDYICASSVTLVPTSQMELNKRRRLASSKPRERNLKPNYDWLRKIKLQSVIEVLLTHVQHGEKMEQQMSEMSVYYLIF